jgi:hypothetical protein
VLLAATLVFAPARARAQQYLLGASGEVGVGVQGGGAGNVALSFARPRIRLGFDVRVDEFPKDIYQLGILTEVVPHASFGVDGRYARRLGEKWEVSLGGMGILAPASLFGPLVALQYRLPLSSSSAVVVGPEVDTFVVGSDLPQGTVIWQCLLQLGVHADL